MTPATLALAVPYAGPRAGQFAAPLTEAFLEFGITTPQRQAAFLAQVAHESGSFRYTLELADGRGYEGRADLGNNQPGDGPRYRGRGLLQITGKANYRDCGDALHIDLIGHPELLEAPLGACRSAGWYWQAHRLNEYADSDRFGTLTKAINGGFNGLDDRITHWLKARKALGL